MRRDAFKSALFALLVAAPLLYLSYRLIAWGLQRGTIRDLWATGIYGLAVGLPGLYFLAGAIAATIMGITGHELPTSPETETAGNPGSNRNVSAEIDIDDGDDSDD